MTIEQGIKVLDLYGLVTYEIKGFTEKSKDSCLSAFLNKLAHSLMLAWSMFVQLLISLAGFISVIASTKNIRKLDWEEEEEPEPVQLQAPKQ